MVFCVSILHISCKWAKVRTQRIEYFNQMSQGCTKVLHVWCYPYHADCYVVIVVLYMYMYFDLPDWSCVSPRSGKLLLFLRLRLVSGSADLARTKSLLGGACVLLIGSSLLLLGGRGDAGTCGCCCWRLAACDFRGFGNVFIAFSFSLLCASDLSNTSSLSDRASMFHQSQQWRFLWKTKQKATILYQTSTQQMIEMKFDYFNQLWL